MAFQFLLVLVPLLTLSLCGILFVLVFNDLPIIFLAAVILNGRTLASCFLRNKCILGGEKADNKTN